VKSFLGKSLVAGLCLSATVPAGSGTPAPPQQTSPRAVANAENRANAENPDRRAVGRSRSRATVYRDNPYISIGSARLDVRLGAATQIPRGWTHEDAATRRGGADPYRLVKFAGPVGGRERARLEAGGFEVIAYYPYNTFLVRPTVGHATAALADVEGVTWVGRFHPYFKIGREVADRLSGLEQAKASDGDGWGERYTIGLHDSGRRQEVEGIVAAIPGVDAVLPSRGPVRIRVSRDLLAEALQSVAALPEVAYVEPWHRPTVSNDENVQTGQSGTCNPNGPEAPNTAIFNHGITGWNARIVISDTCVDVNEGWFYDDVLGSLPAHESSAPWNSVPPDWAQRKVVEYYDMYSGDTTIGCGGSSGCVGACPDHGTHVSGSAAGNCNLDLEGVATPTDPANRDGDNDGVAPGARLIAQDLGDGTLAYLGVDGGDLGELINVAYANTCESSECGIDIHNNSWNFSTDAYEINARTGDRELWSLKNLVVVVSMGNVGVNGYDTVLAPATGKNVIGVGSALQCGTNDVASGSSRGDTSDGRLKPDVVMGGDSVASALNDGDGSTNANGGCEVDLLNGTSMAAGTTSGLAALALQYYNDGFYPTGSSRVVDALDPSGMLLKATLINAGRRMTGAGAEPSGVTWPNMDQGWGYVVLEDALYFTDDDRKLWVHDEAVGVDVSGPASLSFQRGVSSSTEPLKVTLVWYDREHPGSCGSGAPCLLNDLDLTVTDDTTGKSYSVTLVPGSPEHVLPRTVVASNPQPGQTTTDNGPDTLNTVEQIVIYNPTSPANYTFTVNAASTPDGSIPFALVATGALDEPCPLPSNPANNTAADIATCGDSGVLVTWEQDPPDWGDGGGGTRVYEVLRDGQPIATGGCAGLRIYGATSCTDDTGPDNVAVTYTVRYRSGCGGAVATTGVVATDRTPPAVDVTPDGATNVCPGASVLFSAGVDSGVGPYTYQWLESGDEIPGETGAMLSVTKDSVQTRHYNCRVSDTGTGCAATDASTSVGQWTTDFSDVDYDVSFNPVPTLTEWCGDGDGVVEPGEAWQVTTRLRNTAACGVASNARADLSPAAGSAVPASVCGATGYYGPISAGGTATHTYSFEVPQTAVCGENATFDVDGIWWSGGQAAAVQPAFDFQVGVPSEGNNETATQFADPLDVTSGTGFSVMLPATTLSTVTQAQFDYALSCGPGPLQEIYSTGFNSLSGWSTTGNVSSDNAITDSCIGSSGDNAWFDGDGTISRGVSTAGLAGVRIEANWRGGGQYSDPGECFKWWYSIDGGSEWILYKDLCGAAIPNGNWTCVESFEFPATADDNSSFEIRFETTGGVDVRLDGLLVEGGNPPCDETADVRIKLGGPGGDLTIKDFGDPDPPKPIDVTDFYSGADGGPGLWSVEIFESSGGIARISSAALSITDAVGGECDLSTSCSCPAGPPGEVSDDPGHFLRLYKNGANVDLVFEDLGAASYNVYVSTEPGTLPFVATSTTGKSDCAVPTSGAPAGLLKVVGYDVDSGVSSPSDIHYILVTADDGGANEGTPGYASSATERSTDASCVP